MMKKCELIVLPAILCLLLVTCNKEPTEIEYPYGMPDSCSFLLCHLDHFYDMGECRAETNYKDWITFARYSIWKLDSNKVSISFERVPEGGCEQTETIDLILHFEIQQTIVLNTDWNTPTAKLHTHGGGYDTGTEQYDLDRDKESVVFIDSFDPDKEEITGRFDLHFVLAENSIGKYDIHRPDTISFQNGTFRAAKRRWCE